MLKQSALFDKLKHKKVSIYQYNMIYLLSQKFPITEENKQVIQSKLPEVYINPDCTLTDASWKLLSEIDMLFKPIKKLKDLEVLGPDYKIHIDTYLELFPTQKLPSGKYARGNKKNIQENFMWFFQEYQYDWDTIMLATERYVEEYRLKNYLYMRTAMFFIKKLVDGTVQSELANYCDIIESSEDYIPERTFKTKVV